MALDFDFDKLDRAIDEIMKASAEPAKSTRAAKPSAQTTSKTATKDMRTKAPVHTRPSRMIGGRVTNKLAEKPVPVKREPESKYSKPGEGRFIDMVSPSSDALNQHKPNYVEGNKEAVATRQTRVSQRTQTHQPRRDGHQLAQPAPTKQDVKQFVSAADRKAPYISPFLPGAEQRINKRPLGAAAKPSTKAASARVDNTAPLRRQASSSVSRRASETALSEPIAQPKSESKAKSILLKVLLFVGIILLGGLIGVGCFVLFG